MKKNMKKVLTWALTGILGLSVFSFPVFAEETDSVHAGQTDIVQDGGITAGVETNVVFERKNGETPEKEKTKADRTILLYDCGADLETNGAMATYNLKQILRANFTARMKRFE